MLESLRNWLKWTIAGEEMATLARYQHNVKSVEHWHCSLVPEVAEAARWIRQYAEPKDDLNDPPSGLSISGLRGRIQGMQADRVPALHPDHIRAERRACMFGDVIENQTYAMQAAVIEQYAGGGAEKAMAWILNTLAGPGHMPDLDAAAALPAAKEAGPAQAWFDMKSAEHDAFRAAHPMPAAPAKGAANG